MWSVKECEVELRNLCLPYLETNQFDVDTFLEAFADFYYDHDIKRYKKEEDGDMILFEYGRYGFQEGDYFTLSFTRQFYKPTNIRQLHFTLYFDVENEILVELGAANFWNGNLTKSEWINQARQMKVIEAIKEEKFIQYKIHLSKV